MSRSSVELSFRWRIEAVAAAATAGGSAVVKMNPTRSCGRSRTARFEPVM
jgi:hypothetical protein